MQRSTRQLMTLAVTALATLAVPAAAGAATLNGGPDGTVTYTAASGFDNRVFFTDDSPGVVRVSPNDTDPITATGTCAEDSASPGEFTCAGTRIAASGGDGRDELSSDSNDPATLDGGTGDDNVYGGNGPSTLLGGPGDDDVEGGSANDVIDGGAGDDYLYGGGGADDVHGGSGIDFTDEGASGDPAPNVNVTLDDVADDGGPNEGDNLHSDIEDAGGYTESTGSTASQGVVRMVGSAGSNSLFIESSSSRGDITGGPGNDILSGGPLDDSINSRDGFADRVTCGPGNDTVVADTLDTVSDSCENVQLADVGNATEDHAPTVAFVNPAKSGQSIATSKPTVLSATAADDRGIAKVQFVDDDKVVCEDTTAPYTCNYQPRGGDVGRNTLAAVAIDTAQQSATAFRTVSVGRFAAKSVSLKVSPKKDAKLPFSFTASGKVTLPSTVSRSQGCKGAVVSVQVKAGKATVSNRRTKLKANCTYSQKVTFRDRKRFTSSGALKFTAHYQGNKVVTRKVSKPTNVKTK
jgi:Ca2+-binding RTX toxin-like protein